MEDGSRQSKQYMRGKVLITGLFMVIFVPQAFAASVSVVGNINNGDPTTYRSQVVFENTSSKQAITGVVDQMGRYTVFVLPGNYDITVVPPAGSKLARITERNQKIEANAVQNIAVPAAQHQVIPPSFRSLRTLLLIVVVVGFGGVTLFALRKKRQ